MAFYAVELALLRQLLGTGIGNPALGLLVARHDRPNSACQWASV
jgi:hypothetical protein